MNKFPFPESRNGQKEIIIEIQDAIDNNYEYIILEAGTGVGKSAIATTLAEYNETAYIFATTKQLQWQYEKDFDYPRIMGRNAFNCKQDKNKIFTCNEGICQQNKKFKCKLMN